VHKLCGRSRDRGVIKGCDCIYISDRVRESRVFIDMCVQMRFGFAAARIGAEGNAEWALCSMAFMQLQGLCYQNSSITAWHVCEVVMTREGQDRPSKAKPVFGP
jgi:hypothetical protein